MKTLEDLLQKVKELEPLIREHAAEAEANHRLPKVTVEAIRKAGLFRIWVPETLEGWEVDPVTACRTFEEIARIDSATGWLVQMSNAIGALGLFFGDQAVEEMYGGDTIFADALHPQGTAIPVEGGFELTGQFPFASACHHADWFLALAKVMDGNEPRLADGVPETRMMSLPMSDAEVVDNWDTLGMRGTGSHDVKVQGAFIPEHRAPAFEPVSEARSRAWSPAMSNLTIWHITVSVGTIPLGIAPAPLSTSSSHSPSLRCRRTDQMLSTPRPLPTTGLAKPRRSWELLELTCTRFSNVCGTQRRPGISSPPNESATCSSPLPMRPAQLARLSSWSRRVPEHQQFASPLGSPAIFGI